MICARISISTFSDAGSSSKIVVGFGQLLVRSGVLSTSGDSFFDQTVDLLGLFIVLWLFFLLNLSFRGICWLGFGLRGLGWDRLFFHWCNSGLSLRGSSRLCLRSGLSLRCGLSLFSWLIALLLLGCGSVSWLLAFALRLFTFTLWLFSFAHLRLVTFSHLWQRSISGQVHLNDFLLFLDGLFLGLGMLDLSLCLAALLIGIDFSGFLNNPHGGFSRG